MKITAEERLQNSLNRLLKRKPERVKATGRLTLNKINREAGFGQSYIHKFKSFIDEVANPAIERYNNDINIPNSPIQATAPNDVNIISALNDKFKREERLKNKYRKENEDLQKQVEELGSLNRSLMFRIYELQQNYSERVYEIEKQTK